jgi:hypothetical protein
VIDVALVVVVGDESDGESAAVGVLVKHAGAYVFDGIGGDFGGRFCRAR